MQSISYMGDGSTTEFTFNFPYYENSNIIVTVNNSTASGYTIVGTSAGLDADIPYTGGKVVFDVAPTALDSIKISRDLPLTRVVDYQPTVQLNPTTLNQDMNYMMEVIKDVKDEFGDLSTKYAEIANKESTTTLLARIDEISDEISDVNDTITDFNTEIENGRIMSKDDFYSYTTNCITEIPQDIKLELNSGTLTVKAGTVYYIPTGSGVFTKQTLSADATVSAGSADALYYILLTSNGSVTRIVSTSVYSGNSEPTFTGSALWYDTTNNVIKFSQDSGATWDTGGWSLPIAICTPQSSTWAAINQVFHGFGYIGSTIFVLPGVKYLSPYGKNLDGSLKNILATMSSVQIATRNSSSNGSYLYARIANNNSIQIQASYKEVNSLPTTANNGDMVYLISENKLYTYSSGTWKDAIGWCIGPRFIKTQTGETGITSFETRYVFHIFNANETEYIGHQATPSDKYIDLTLPASGSTISAPADGYLTVSKDATAASQYINFINGSNGMNCNSIAPDETTLCLYIPVAKADVITINYNAIGTTNMFRFIYTNGAK